MEYEAPIQRLKGLTGQRACGSRAAALSLVCALLRGASGIPAHADQIIVTASKDNTLYETADGSTSNGAGTATFAGRNSQASNSIRRALLRFDISGDVPAGSTVTSVQLTMYNDAANAQNESVSMHRVLVDWGEGTSIATGGQGSGAAASAGDSTWLHPFFNTQLWNQPGGDFEPSASASTVVGAEAMSVWGSTAAMVADVQSWLDSPTTNFGWCIVGSETAPSTAKRFATREQPDASRRPTLVVEYVPSAFPIPTLSEWGTVLLALLLLVAGALEIVKRGKTTLEGRGRTPSIGDQA